VLSSPYKRAVDTVQDFADKHGFTIRAIEDFRERRIDSVWIDDFIAFSKKQWEDFSFKLSDGESLSEVQERNIRALESVVREYSGQNIVVGSHGTAISTIINYYDKTFGYAGFNSIKGLMPWVAKFTFEDNRCVDIEQIDLFIEPFKCSIGDVDESISIMREAAQWLLDSGKPMWSLDELNKENLHNNPDEYLVMYDANGIGMATLLLSFEDTFFWPHIPPNTSGFIHKLAVRREFSGTGVAEKLVKYAETICADRGIYTLRLDCDSHRTGLCKFYERIGFDLVERKTISTKRLGIIDLAMYKKELR
jgi:2,3-bisphosphoglycerate-dependent phosphoglycerate mutase